MIGDGCKAIIVSAVNGPSLDSGLEKALKKGVPIFTCDRLIMENEAVSYCDSYQVGMEQGKTIRKNAQCLRRINGWISAICCL